MNEARRILAGRYEVRGVLGGGGMSVVHRGWDRRLDRPIAIKVLRPQYGADPAFLRRFMLEARRAASIAHPNVVPIFDQGEDGGVPFLVMELVEGPSLATVLRARHRLAPVEAAAIAEGVAAGLAAAHQRRIVHRDVKPANILLDPDGRARVVDFGIARALSDADATGTGLILGSIPYLSPEQARGEPATTSSDVYSLGLVLYEMLTGVRPFEAATPAASVVARIDRIPPPPSSIVEDLSATIDGIVLRALAPRAEDRFRGARQFERSLSAWRDEQSAGTHAAANPLPALAGSALTARPPLAADTAPPRARPTARPSETTRGGSDAATAQMSAAAGRPRGRDGGALAAAVPALAGAAGPATSVSAIARPTGAAGSTPRAPASAGPRSQAEATPTTAARRPSAAGGMPRAGHGSSSAAGAGSGALATATAASSGSRPVAATAQRPVPSASGPPGRRALQDSGRRRRLADVLLLAILLGAAFVVLLALGRLSLGTPVPTSGVLGAISTVAASPSPSAASPSMPSPSPSPAASASSSPTPTPSPSPSPSPSPHPPSPFPSPSPLRPAAAAPAPTSLGPVDTVRSFYSLVAEHRFAAAAALWSPRMRAAYPPSEYIDSRFADTTGITIRRIGLVRATATSATVAVDLVEYRDVAPTVREFIGSWDLVRLGGRWYMDAPHF